MLLGQLGFIVCWGDGPVYHGARDAGGDASPHRPSPVGQCGLSGAIFVFSFALQTSLARGLQPSAVVAPSMPTQFYCGRCSIYRPSFSKAAMQKEMDALNAICATASERKLCVHRQKSCRSSTAKCHEPEVQIADLPPAPDEATTRTNDETAATITGAAPAPTAPPLPLRRSTQLRRKSGCSSRASIPAPKFC